MGVVNLGEQRASRQVLGNVRMGITPDLSKQWRGLQSIGEGISDLAFAIPRAINTLDAAFERDAENEANKLYSAYLTHMEESLNSPGDPNNPDGAKGLFVRAEEDDDAAKSLNENIKTAREQILETIGYNDASKRTQEKFKLRAQNYDFSTDRKANSIMTARFQFSEKANASLALETATRVAMNDPTDANLDACRMAFLSVAKANGYTDAQTETGMGALNRNLAVGLLVEKAAGTQNPEEVQQIIESVKKGDVRFMGGEDKERGEWIQETFDQLQPTEKKALLGKLATRESMVKDNQDKLYQDGVIDCKMQVRNGTLTAAQLGEKVEEWKKVGAPIQYVNQLDELRFATWNNETANTIQKTVGTAIDQKSSESAKKTLEAMTSAEKAHPMWQQAMSAIDKGLGEMFLAQQREECAVRYDMAIYNNGEYLRTVEERKRIIDNNSSDPNERGLLQRGFLSEEEADKAIKKIEASEDARIQPILERITSHLADFAVITGRAGKDMIPEIANARWKLNGTKVDINSTLAEYRRYGENTSKARNVERIANAGAYLQEVYDKVVDFSATHPEATPQQIENFAGDLLYPILPYLTAKNIAEISMGDRIHYAAKFAAVDAISSTDAPREAWEERARYNPHEGHAFKTYPARETPRNAKFSGTPTQMRVKKRADEAVQATPDEQ